MDIYQDILWLTKSRCQPVIYSLVRHMIAILSTPTNVLQIFKLSRLFTEKPVTYQQLLPT